MHDQIFEFRWKDENSPYFRIIRNDTLNQHMIPFGNNLSLEVIGMYSCSGYEKNGEYHPCIMGGAPGTRKCEECKKQEGMSAVQYCDGFNTEMFSSEELEALNCPHYLYLAMFDRGLVKVGVSSSNRGYLRQIEQGTHFVYIIAEGMWGVPARQMETIIRKNGMVDKIQGSQKKDLMFPNISKKEAEKEFQELAQKHLSAVLAERPDMEQYLKKPAELKEFSQYYRLEQAMRVQKPIQNIDLLLGESISGTLIAAKGNFLLLETEAERVLINAKKLKGYPIDLSAKPIGLKKEEAFQGALF